MNQKNRRRKHLIARCCVENKRYRQFKRAYQDVQTGHEGHAYMNHQKPRDRSRIEPARARSSEAMGEQRYQELMQGLNHLFLETEHYAQHRMNAERQRVIEEINSQMSLHGLTWADLVD